MALTAKGYDPAMIDTILTRPDPAALAERAASLGYGGKGVIAAMSQLPNGCMRGGRATPLAGFDEAGAGLLMRRKHVQAFRDTRPGRGRQVPQLARLAASSRQPPKGGGAGRGAGQSIRVAGSSGLQRAHHHRGYGWVRGGRATPLVGRACSAVVERDPRLSPASRARAAGAGLADGRCRRLPPC